MKLKISPALLERLETYLESHYPNEAAGLLLGKSVQEGQGEILDLYMLKNNFEEQERYHRYKIEGLDMLRAEDAAAERDMQILGVFHSHPDHPSRPSEYDREYALPWFAYLITSVESGKAAESQTWRLAEDRSKFNEIELEIKP
jgi:proteasome lid subunit RPN8/RPN11